MALRAAPTNGPARTFHGGHASPQPVAAVQRRPLQGEGPSVRPRFAQMADNDGDRSGQNLAPGLLHRGAAMPRHGGGTPVSSPSTASGAPSGAVVQRNGSSSEKKTRWPTTMFNVFKHLASPGGSPHEWNSPNRQALHDVTQSHPSFHANLVSGVNRGLDESHVDLTDQSREGLSSVLQDRSNRSIGQTSAHFREVGNFARDFFTKGAPYSLTGMGMNFAGAMVAGANEHRARKTGNSRLEELYSAKP